jgi:hypothetical protein
MCLRASHIQVAEVERLTKSHAAKRFDMLEQTTLAWCERLASWDTQCVQ